MLTASQQARVLSGPPRDPGETDEEGERSFSNSFLNESEPVERRLHILDEGWSAHPSSRPWNAQVSHIKMKWAS